MGQLTFIFMHFCDTNLERGGGGLLHHKMYVVAVARCGGLIFNLTFLYRALEHAV